MSDMMLTQREAERMILNHYGQSKQEMQAVQELTEVILLLTARPDQRDSDYRAKLTEEIADAIVMIEQVKMMHNISDDDITENIVYKLRRTLDRIDKELQHERENLQAG